MSQCITLLEFLGRECKLRMRRGSAALLFLCWLSCACPIHLNIQLVFSHSIRYQADILPLSLMPTVIGEQHGRRFAHTNTHCFQRHAPQLYHSLQLSSRLTARTELTHDSSEYRRQALDDLGRDILRHPTVKRFRNGTCNVCLGVSVAPQRDGATNGVLERR